MAGINKVILIGNLGKDPEVRHLDQGVTVAKFPLATSETYKKQDGTKVENTEWHNVVLWRGLAESAERFLRKGSLVYIEGKIRTRSWDDKEGNKRYATEIVADVMTMLGKRSDEPAPTAGATHEETKAIVDNTIINTAPEPGDDLPF